MPDRFKILEDSFSGDHPAPDDDGFQDFNAFARMNALPPVVDTTAEEPAKSVETKMTSMESVPPRAQEAIAPQQAARASSRSADHPPAAEAPRTMRGFTRSEAAVQAPLERPVPHVDVEEAPLPWRKMSLREVFMLLRSATPEKSEAQPRLRGMFRR